VKPCAHILLELPVVDSNFLHGQPDVTGTGTMATKIVSIHKRVKRIYRVGQKVAHFLTHHIFVTFQDVMKRISPKCSV